MTTFEKLAEKIKADLDMEVVNFQRCYPGYWQRSGGAYSWAAQIKNTGSTIGSQWPATYLLKCKKLALAERALEIWPDEDHKNISEKV